MSDLSVAVANDLMEVLFHALASLEEKDRAAVCSGLMPMIEEATEAAVEAREGE
jgi:hypothetical protein